MQLQLHDDSLPFHEADFPAALEAVGWSHGDWTTLHEIQWQYLSPVFSAEEFRRQCHPGTVLAIIELGERSSLGSFGCVRKARIHADHHEGFDEDVSQTTQVGLDEPRLCRDCQEIDLKSSHWKKIVAYRALKSSQSGCDLCRLLFMVPNQHFPPPRFGDPQREEHIQYCRVGSRLKMVKRNLW